MTLRIYIMARYLPNNYNQLNLVPINFNDHLQPGTFEYSLHYLLEFKIDLAAFDEDYKNDQLGRLAYDPSMLLKIILFAYYKGITSSREIAWCCETNITFMALACLRTPHWTSIASFVSSHCDAIKSVFEKVLLICDTQGLIGHELVAIDGCKLPSDASKQWSGTFDELEAKRTKIQSRIDWAMQEQQRLDEAGESDRAGRQQQSIETLSKAAEKIEAFLDQHEPRQGTGKQGKEVKSNITDNDSAKMKTNKGVIQGYNGVTAVDKKHQVIVATEVFGQGPEQSTLPGMLDNIQSNYDAAGIEKNLVEDDIIVTADTGFSSVENMGLLHDKGFNAYIPDNQFRSRDARFNDRLRKPGRQRKTKQRRTLAASEFDFDPINETCRCPAEKEMRRKNRREDQHGNKKLYFEGRLSHCRDCPMKEKCLRNPKSADNRKGHGRQVSFILEKKPGAMDWMRRRVDSDRGKAIYAHRMSVVEPVFGNIESNKGLDRFSLRSKEKVNIQWQLYSLVHNIEKLHRYGKLVA